VLQIHYKHTFLYHFVHWVILLYHLQVILEKQKGSMKRKHFSRVVSPLAFKTRLINCFRPSINFLLTFFSQTTSAAVYFLLLCFFFFLFLCSLSLSPKPEALSSIFEIKEMERHYLRRVFLNLCEGSASNTKAFVIV
jgi:hypothetical protein